MVEENSSVEATDAIVSILTNFIDGGGKHHICSSD